jgi:3-hydroxybutyryl-CoA dehydratase
MEKVFFEDYQVGEKFVSPGRTITETDIVQFAGLTGDWHPIHTNVEYAKKTVFGERIAHGMLGLSVGMALVFRLGPFIFTPKKFIAFYGMDKVRFVGPIKIGDTIRCEVTIAELQEHDEKSGTIGYEAYIKNQRDEDCIFFTAKALAGRKKKE